MANYRGDFSERSPLAQEYFVEVNMNQEQLDIESLWKISFWAVNRCMFSFSWGDYFHKALELEPVWSWAAGGSTGGVCSWVSCPWCPCSDCRVHPSILLCFLFLFSSASSIAPCYLKSPCSNSTRLSPLLEVGSVCFQKGKELLAAQ